MLAPQHQLLTLASSLEHQPQTNKQPVKFGIRLQLVLIINFNEH